MWKGEKAMGIFGDRVSKYGVTGFIPGFPAKMGKFPLFLIIVLLGSGLTVGNAWAINPNAPPSLKLVQVIEPPNLNDFLNPNNPGGLAAARLAAIALGKALLWDVQMGSDGKTACASCHFNAGVDNRVTNTLNPGFNRRFNVSAVNSTLLAGGSQFPFHQRVPPVDFQSSRVLRDSDDVVGSQGIRLTQFVDIVLGSAVEQGAPLADPTFSVPGPVPPQRLNVRQVTGRNSPTYINAAFNFDSFHDGRANNVFNGVNPFGAADQNARVLENAGGPGGNMGPQTVRLIMANLASQAVGPPMSAVEMAFTGRSFPKIAKKLLFQGSAIPPLAPIIPLATQRVHPDDSIFGPLGMNIVANPTGLAMSYVDLIQAAFHPKYWENTSQKVTFPGGVMTVSAGAADPLNTGEFTQMEANFSMFLGLALMMYETILIANDTKFDQFQEGLPVYTPQEELGLELFLSMGCGACHGGPEFQGHTQIAIQGFSAVGTPPSGAIGAELQPRFGLSFVDEGIYNIGVRPTREDIGRGGSTPPLDTRPRPANRNRTFPLSYTALAFLNLRGLLPAEMAAMIPPFPINPQSTRRTDMIQGAFKVPTLRNVELTGPYFHNGSVGTLGQIMDFYARGGNFPRKNARNLHPAIVELFPLQGQDARHQDIIAFLLTLTDNRVAFEANPFDHPEIVINAGQNAAGNDQSFTIPAVGAGGRQAEAPPLPRLQPFMNLDPFGG